MTEWNMNELEVYKIKHKWRNNYKYFIKKQQK